MRGSSLDELHREWLKRPGYKAAYVALAEEFNLASAMIEARAAAGLTLAKSMADDATLIAHLESGKVKPLTTAD